MKRLLIFTLIVFTTQVYAQVTIHNLDDALQLLRQQNHEYKIAELADRISQEKVTASRSALLPQVKAFGGFDNNISLPVQLVPSQFLGGREGDYSKVQFGTRYATNIGAEASLSLVNVSNWKNIAVAKEGRLLSSFERRQQNLQLTERVIRQYYSCLFSKEAIRMTNELFMASDSLLRAADARMENGSIELLDYNRVKSLYLETLQRYRNSKSLYKSELNALKHELGISITDSLLIVDSLGFSVNAGTLRDLEIDPADLPLYKISVAKESQAHKNLLRQQSKVLPEVSLYARYTRQSFTNQAADVYGSQWFDVGVIGIRAEWNLFTGLARQAAIQEASLQKSIAEKERTMNASEAQRQLQDLAINHRLSFETMKNCRERYELRRVNYVIAGVKYNEGVYGIDQYISFYDDMVQAQNLYLESLSDFLVQDAIVQSRNKLAP